MFCATDEMYKFTINLPHWKVEELKTRAYLAGFNSAGELVKFLINNYINELITITIGSRQRTQEEYNKQSWDYSGAALDDMCEFELITEVSPLGPDEIDFEHLK